jgi:glucan phosphorylase
VHVTNLTSPGSECNRTCGTATYKHFHEQNPKQAYYISMEFLQGRALTNAIGNLGLKAGAVQVEFS